MSTPFYSETPSGIRTQGMQEMAQNYRDSIYADIYGHQAHRTLNEIDSNTINSIPGANTWSRLARGDFSLNHLTSSNPQSSAINRISNSRNNFLWGTNYNDVLRGGDGSDSLYGNGGHDFLFGDNGNDYLFGGDGNDGLSGGNGSDLLWGGNGNDFLFGNDGNDGLSGGNGNDFLAGESGNDFLLGNNGNDILLGGSGDDSLHGNYGNDILIGGSGSDILSGDSGNDYLNGYAGGTEYDQLLGGSGTDLYVLGNETNAYYQGNGFAILGDFDPSYDYIMLKGSSSDYSMQQGNWLGSSSLDTLIRYRGDAIGIVEDVSQVRFNLDVIFV